MFPSDGQSVSNRKTVKPKNIDEHVLTNPRVPMASQGGSVDWFRFWLQGYEDPDPTKDQQYQRWRELRKEQSLFKPTAAAGSEALR